MTHVRLDDGFFRNPKARRLGKDGRALYLAGLCYCNAEMTDGVITKELVPVLVVEAEVRPATVRTLLDAGAWVEVNGHYEVHDYLTHQRSKASILKERERWRRNKRGDDPAGESS